MFNFNGRYFFNFFNLLLFFALSGCQNTQAFKEPQLRLLNIEVQELKLLEQKFILHLQVDNPNILPLAFRRLSYRLWLNGMELGSGQLEKRFSVPAEDSRLLQVPLNTNIWQHLKPLSDSLKKPTKPIQYRLEGKIKTGWTFGDNLFFNSQGEITPADYLPEM